MWISGEGVLPDHSAKSIASWLMPAWHCDSSHYWYCTQIFLPNGEFRAAVVGTVTSFCVLPWGIAVG